ncbi:MAG TPA: hypothetical protein VG455_08855 [Acidimicrobiales bacterium]|nr:hypothetical protein [Acidimicrobiales bacterium]
MSGAPIVSAVALLVSARAAELDRAGVTSIGAVVVAGGVAATVAASLRPTAFRVVAGLDVAVLLYLVLWGGWWLLPMALLVGAAIFTAEAGAERPPWLLLASGPVLAAAVVAGAALVVPPDVPDLWACYDPARASPDTNAVFDELSQTTARGRRLRRGVASVSVRSQGVRVEIDPYVEDGELADIRGRLARAPGVTAVKSGAPC